MDCTTPLMSGNEESGTAQKQEQPIIAEQRQKPLDDAVFVDVNKPTMPKKKMETKATTRIMMSRRFDRTTLFFISLVLVGLLVATITVPIASNNGTPLSRHKLAHDYTDIDIMSNWKAASSDHLCLFGGDDACRCEGFTEPVPRDEIKGWVSAHEANKASLKLGYDYDVIFLGDDMVELWNGKLLNMNYARQNGIDDGAQIKAYFNKTFTKDGGGDLDGLALGINGDSSSNLLWRIKHGEMPNGLNSKVWWLWIGTNDLARGGCSEEATVLGILRVAEEIAYHNPGSVVVIMAILPRSSRADGSLESKRPSRVDHFFSKNSEEQLWPSIQAVNQQLKEFCQKNKKDHMIYFDGSAYFWGSVGNEYFKGRKQEIRGYLMPDYVHPNYCGYKVLGDAIRNKLYRIILDEDEDDFEENGGS